MSAQPVSYANINDSSISVVELKIQVSCPDLCGKLLASIYVVLHKQDGNGIFNVEDDIRSAIQGHEFTFNPVRAIEIARTMNRRIGFAGRGILCCTIWKDFVVPVGSLTLVD